MARGRLRRIVLTRFDIGACHPRAPCIPNNNCNGMHWDDSTQLTTGLTCLVGTFLNMPTLSSPIKAFKTGWIPLLVLSLLLLCCLSFVRSSRVFVVSTECVLSPESDDALADWLKRQPGVVGHTVRIIRHGEHGIEVSFIQLQSLWGQPPFPTLEFACAKFGYSLSRPFEDAPTR